MTDKSVSQVALPAGASVTAPSISARSVIHQGTCPLLCGVSPVGGSVGRGAWQVLEHLCSCLYGREGEGAIASSRGSRGSCNAQDLALPGSETPQHPTSQDQSTAVGWGKDK